MDEFKPAIFTRKEEQNEKEFLAYCDANHIDRFVDEYVEAAQESQSIQAPSNIFLKEKPIPPHDKSEGVWVCYPWRNTAVHTLDQAHYNAVRLSRNRDLLTVGEARVLATKHIVIAGLNVGNPAAICMVQEGIGGSYKYADNDILGLSNLNRFRAGLPDIGVNKAVLSARQAYELDPFSDIEVYPKGISQDNLAQFLDGADLLIEEMDNLPLKISVREEARKRKIPTVMITGNGAGVILDVERFDLEPELPLLSGHLTQAVIDGVMRGPASPQEKLQLAQDFMGKEFLTERLNRSFALVGKSIIGIPQLGEASFLRGAVLAHTIKRILLREDVRSGRYLFQLSDIFRNVAATPNPQE